MLSYLLAYFYVFGLSLYAQRHLELVVAANFILQIVVLLENGVLLVR